MDIFKLLSRSQKVKDFVKKYYNVSSCVLLVSEDSEILYYVSKLFAMAHNCSSEYPCLECPECQKIINNSSIEFYSYPKAKDKISVEDINEVVDSLSKKPLENDTKIYIFNRIDEATEESENKLLKSMEEFPSYAKLIFTATNIHSILRTILSRVEVIYVPKFTLLEFTELLLDFDNNSSMSLDSLYDISSGNLLNGLKLMNDESTKQIYDNCLEILSEVSKSNICRYSTIITKNDIEEYLKFFSIIVSKMIYAKTSGSGEFDLITSKYTLKSLTDIAKIVELSNKKLIANVNEQGIIDNLLIKIMELKK